jgi:hypothetical protein
MRLTACVAAISLVSCQQLDLAPKGSPATDAATGANPLNSGYPSDAASSDDYADTATDSVPDVPVATVCPGFDAPVVYATTNMPATIVVGDFTGRGYVDIVVGEFVLGSAQWAIELFSNSGDGSFTMQSSTGGVGPYATVASGIFNSSGRLDLVEQMPDGVAIDINLGGGVFSSQVSQFNTQTVDGQIGVGDINGDGLADIAVADPRSRATVGCPYQNVQEPDDTNAHGEARKSRRPLSGSFEPRYSQSAAALVEETSS